MVPNIAIRYQPIVVVVAMETRSNTLTTNMDGQGSRWSKKYLKRTTNLLSTSFIDLQKILTYFQNSSTV